MTVTLVAAAALVIILTSPQAECQLTAEAATLMGGRGEDQNYLDSICRQQPADVRLAVP